MYKVASRQPHCHLRHMPKAKILVLLENIRVCAGVRCRVGIRIPWEEG